MEPYIKSTGTDIPRLVFEDLYVQSFKYSPSINSAYPEFNGLREYAAQTDVVKSVQLQIIIFIATHRFATAGQLKRFLALKSFEIEDIESVMEEMVKMRQVNFFILSDSEVKEFPEDAEKYYCLDWAGKYIYTNYADENYWFWKVTDNLRNAGQVQDCLWINEFHISVYSSRGDKLKVFDPLVAVHLKTKDAKFSAWIEAKTRSNEDARFILEVVSPEDLPMNFTAKCNDSINQFMYQGQWKRLCKEEPRLIFLCANVTDAEEVARTYYQFFEKLNYSVTTLAEVLKGMGDALVYRFDGTSFESGQISALR